MYLKFEKQFNEKYEMSLLWRVSNYDRLIVKNGFLTINAYYSRRSKSEELESFYKYVSGKPNVRGLSICLVLHNFFFIDFFTNLSIDKLDLHLHEGGPNWEIFNPKGNRFYLPNSLGPAWQSAKSIIELNVNLYSLIDFDSKVMFVDSGI